MKELPYLSWSIYLLLVAFGMTGCSVATVTESKVPTAEPAQLLPTFTSVIQPTETKPSDSTASPTPADPVIDFNEIGPGPSCTELGCNSSLQVHFDNFIPENYLVQVIGDREDKIVLHCFEPDQGDSFPYTVEHYPLESPDLVRYQPISTAFNQCGPDVPGMARIVTRANDSIDQIIVFCNQWVAYLTEAAYDGTIDCHQIPDGFTIDYPTQFLPETVTMTVSWDTSTKSFEFHPEYEAYRPNGPECEPECLYTDLWLTLR